MAAYLGRLLSKLVPTVTSRTPVAPNPCLPLKLSPRLFSATPVRSIKEIRETKNGDETVIEAVFVEHPINKNILNVENKTGCCVLCLLNLDLKYHDVLIISQFLHPTRGTMMHRRITGLCREKQRLVEKLAYAAGKAGLLKKVFTRSRGTKLIMPKKPGHSLPRHYARWKEESLWRM